MTISTETLNTWDIGEHRGPISKRIEAIYESDIAVGLPIYVSGVTEDGTLKVQVHTGNQRAWASSLYSGKANEVHPVLLEGIQCVNCVIEETSGVIAGEAIYAKLGKFTDEAVGSKMGISLQTTGNVSAGSTHKILILLDTEYGK